MQGQVIQSVSSRDGDGRVSPPSEGISLMARTMASHDRPALGGVKDRRVSPVVQHNVHAVDKLKANSMRRARDLKVTFPSIVIIDLSYLPISLLWVTSVIYSQIN